jgi:hypothetical protein
VGTEHLGLLVAQERLLAGSDRDLVQHPAAEAPATESFRKLGCSEARHPDFIGYYDQTAKAIRWSYTVEKLEQNLAVN